MPEKRTIGCVRLRPRGENWQADFRNPKTGRRDRRLIRAVNQTDAERQGLDLHVRLTTGQFQSVPADDLAVVDAFGRAIADSRGRPRTRRHYASQADLFRGWLAETRPAVRYWSEVHTDTLRAYVSHCVKVGLAHESIRHRLAVVKLTSRYWYENDPERYRDAARPVRMPLKSEDPFERAEKERAKALCRDDLVAFLDFLKNDRPHIGRIVMLQAMCGLRLMEALALRECDVDFRLETIRVAKTETHEPKTPSSYRVIPVPTEVLAMLRDQIATLPIGNRERPIMLGQDNAEPYRDHSGYLAVYRRAVGRFWKQTGLDLRRFQPHWFRATFASAVRSLGADVRHVQAYLGHSRRDVLGQFYEQIGLAQLRSVTAAFEKWCHQSGTEGREARIAIGGGFPVSVAESVVKDGAGDGS